MAVSMTKCKKRFSPRDCARYCGALILAAAMNLPGFAQAEAGSSPLVVAVPADYPPQYSLDAQGQPTGFAIEVMDEVAKLAGIQIQYRIENTWPETIKALKEGGADIIPNLGISEDRKTIFAFTEPVETFPIAIFVRRSEQTISDLDSLEGRKVAAVAGNSALEMLRRQPKIQLAVFLGVEQALFALLSGDVDAVVYPMPWMLKLADEAGVDDRIKVVGKPLLEVKRAIAVQKDNRELLNSLNRAIVAFRPTPKYQAIYTRWYGKSEPYWTVARISTAVTAVAGSLILLILVWHYRSTVVLNRQLKATAKQHALTQAALTDSESRYRTLATVSPVGILQADATGHVHFVNEGWQELAGISLAQAQGLNWLNAVHRDDRAQLQQEWLTAVQEQRSFTAEYRFQRPNGKTTWVLGRTVAEKNAEGQVVGFVGSITDITERKRVESALQESEARWRALTENSPDHILMLDREGRITFINRTMPGLDQDEVLGSVAAEYLPEGQRQLMMQKCDQVFKTAKPASFEVQRRDLDGVHRYFETVAAPLIDGEHVKIVIVYARDITERKMIQRQLHQHQERLEDIVKYRTRDLEASHRELENFSYSISHDLRAPLRRIEGFGKALMEDYGDTLDQGGRDYIERMRDGARQMSRLIEDMLQLSRITRADLNHDWIDVSKLATSLANRLHDQDSVREVNVDIEPGLRVVGDKNLLGVALGALLDNAWKFTRNTQPASIAVGMAKVGEREAYFVRDNGAGFDMAYANKLFAPFQRLHSEAEFPGGGMGLAMVARIIHRHGGEVWGHGEPGQGACFYFTLGKHTASSDVRDTQEDEEEPIKLHSAP
jgi:PAS domain S-box-containing protein